MMKKRLIRELEILRNNPVCGAEIEQETDTRFIVYLPGPEVTKYENNIDKISFYFYNNYPFTHPEIKFITPIDHPLFQKSPKIHIFSLFL